jgi:uncharacterized heparinase superfamily protein
MRLGAWLDTAARAGASRIARRAWRSVRYRWIYPVRRPGRPGTLLLGPVDGRLREALRPADAGSAARASSLRQGRFEFLNLPPVAHGAGFDWRGGPSADPLWLYTLHYGEWALDLALAHRRDPAGGYLAALTRLVGDWLAGNPPGSRPGWEPYPIARRLVAWSSVDALLDGEGDWRALRPVVAESLRRQADLLGANLERDLGNNHLVADYRALAWIGMAYPDWPGAVGRLRLGLRGMAAECRRQVLPDGAHDERSPSYHAIVREDVDRTVRLADAVGTPVPDELRRCLERMAGYRKRVAAPDGSLPLWNDSVPGYPADLDRCDDPPGMAGEGVDLLPDAGVAVLRDGRGGVLWIDCGPMGPRHLPGHGHADTLSICLYGRGRWLVVDPGTVAYHRPELRDALRATAAHATVTVDGLDQCLFWGAFRVAYPPAPRVVSVSARHVEAEHDGYRRLAGPVTHRRRVELAGPGSWRVEDRIEGEGRHACTAALPLAPGAEVSLDGNGFCARWPDGARLSCVAEGYPVGATWCVEEGFVSGGWNLPIPNRRVVLAWEAHGKMSGRLAIGVDAGEGSGA